jgi:hypothetical protein
MFLWKLGEVHFIRIIFQFNSKGSFGNGGAKWSVNGNNLFRQQKKTFKQITKTRRFYINTHLSCFTIFLTCSCFLASFVASINLLFLSISSFSLSIRAIT